VPEFLPFPGIHYAQSRDLAAVCAPPYDVIEPEERVALLARDPYNAVRLILPDTYAGAAARFRAWLDAGVLVADESPAFFWYRMRFTNTDGIERTTVGVVGALALDGSDGAILPHERTLAKAKSDRLELLRATRANFDPIWGLSLASGLSSRLGALGDPVAACVDLDGVRHELGKIAAPDAIDQLRASIAGAPLVMADGHHRLETARAYRRERAEAGIPDPGADHIMAFVVELAPDDLWVGAIHRLVHGAIGPVLRDALAGDFTIEPAGPNEPDALILLERSMAARGALGLVDAEGLALLLPTAALDRKLADLPLPLRTVDAARFDVGVRPALGDAELGYRHDDAAVAAAVAKGAADAAVLLRPVTVEEIRAAAEAGVRMPEKTTFFAPKPRTGMVFRSLDPA
jgi:uncharacterized protein (DUF1015 family)